MHLLIHYTLSLSYFWLVHKQKSMKQIFLSLIAIVLFSCNNEDNNDPATNPITSNPIKPISFSIINSYPHDTSSFTQGLVVHNGYIYEGTGNWGFSKLLKAEIASGKIKQSLSLDDKYFGEGITILRDTIYQLTWKEKKVFAYTLHDFKKVKEFDFSTEGWGITTNGEDLIVSDGTSTLYYYSPADFKLLRTQTVTENNSLSYNLNELEFIDGYIYANQWETPYILKIEPNSGAIVGRIDLTSLWKEVRAKDKNVDVPNGIAYDSTTKKLYITGKKWPDLFEIKLSE